MSARSTARSPVRWLLGLGAIGAMCWVAFEQHERVPVLKWVNLATHELGHMLTYSASDITNAMAGSIAQVAIPLLIAMYFFFRRGDWILAGVCLAWAATSAVEVSLYVADAPTQKLELIGDKHDWAFILGPDGYRAMDQAASLADTIRTVATVAAAIGAVLCLAAMPRGRRQPHSDEIAPTSSATATSRP